MGEGGWWGSVWMGRRDGCHIDQYKINSLGRHYPCQIALHMGHQCSLSTRQIYKRGIEGRDPERRGTENSPILYRLEIIKKT